MRHRLTKCAAAAGILGFCGVANAQSSVTLYGLIDQALYYQNRTSGNHGNLFALIDGGSNSSRWGLRGQEDIGGGMHVGFDLESGFLATTGALGHGNGGLFGRQAYLTVDGNFGTVTTGLQYSPFYYVVALNDPQQQANQGATPMLYVSNFGSAGIFTSNVITYTTPTVGGFSGSFMFGPGGVAGNFNAGKQISAAVTYKVQGLSASIGYLNVHNAAGEVAQEGRIVAATYVWGPLTVNGAVTNYRTPAAGQPLSPTIRDVNVYDGGASYRLTPFMTISGGIYYSRDQNNSANKSLLYSVYGQYFLSKRTNLFSIVSLVRNQGLMSTGVNADVTPFGGLPAGNTVGVNVGIMHRF